MKVAVIGTGYVGLVTATCLADSGNDVVGIDKDESKIRTLEEGRLPIYEPGLLELVQRNHRHQRLRFTTDLKAGVGWADLAFIAVGTPQSADGAADLSSIWKVVDGKIVTRTKFPEGTRLVLQVEEPAPVVELDAEDERAIDRALASVREGKGISLGKFRAILQRL